MTKNIIKRLGTGRKQIDDRPNANFRGYDSRWVKARLRYLAQHPLCAICYQSGRTQKADVVDHIKPHRGDKSLFWDESNWQSLCKECHDYKTGKGL